DVASGAAQIQPVGLAGWIHAAAFHPDGKSFVVGSGDGVVQAWDSVTRQPRGTPLRHERRVNAVAYSPDGTTLVTACEDGGVYLWDAATGQPLGPPLQHQGEVRTAALSGDGKMLVTGLADGSARLWDVATGLCLGPSLSHSGPVLAAFQPKSDKVATIAEDGLLRLWDIPRPAAGDAAVIRQWVESITGKELTDKGILRELDGRASQPLHES